MFYAHTKKSLAALRPAGKPSNTCYLFMGVNSSVSRMTGVLSFLPSVLHRSHTYGDAVIIPLTRRDYVNRGVVAGVAVVEGVEELLEWERRWTGRRRRRVEEKEEGDEEEGRGG